MTVGSSEAMNAPLRIALSLRGMTVAYDGKPAVFSLDADFVAGRMTAIVGPNGAGKSTLLKAALGIVPRVSGEVSVFGGTFEEGRHRIAYVPQRASVDWDFPASVADVVTMGLYRGLGLLGRMRTEHRRRVGDALERVGMQGFAGRQIGQLSGGQQQRVFLARALAENAELYLLDEPFAGVDAATEAAITEVLKGLRDEGRTVVAVHHDLSSVAETFDRVLLLNTEKVAEGPVSDVFTEAAIHKAYGARGGVALNPIGGVVRAPET
ncbi:MAG: metal ABC transporter ATP-binding protein [Hyphomicrobiaceae bacterium]|nr:metal ABC transporter ATP-binding protein [Hyphomicrobiaceae bacterium]